MRKKLSNLNKKFQLFMKAFCSSTVQQENKPQTNNQEQKNKETQQILPPRNKKQKRGNLTLNLQSVFLRVSRKNIIQQQFFADQIISYEMEKHILSRIKSASSALISGEFSEQFYESIIYPIEMLNIKNEPVFSETRESIIVDNFTKLRETCVDAIIYQTSFTLSQFDALLWKNRNVENLTPKMISRYSELQISEIMQLVQNQLQSELSNKVHPHILIVASKYINIQQLTDRLGKYSKTTFMELQKIKKNQQTFSYIIYISNTSEFIRVDQKIIKQSITQKLLLADQYQNKILLEILQQIFYLSNDEQLQVPLIHQSVIYHDLVETLRQLSQKKTLASNSQTKHWWKFQQKIVPIQFNSFNNQKIYKEQNNLVYSRTVSLQVPRSECSLENYMVKLSQKNIEYEKILKKYWHKILKVEPDQNMSETPYLFSLTPDFTKQLK